MPRGCCSQASRSAAFTLLTGRKFWTESPLLLLKISKDIDAVLLKRLEVRRFGDGKKKPRGKKSMLASLTQLKTTKMRE
jgi:hypothetical protein